MPRSSCSHEDHRLLKLDTARWDALPIIGYQQVPAGDEPGEVAYLIELRNCPSPGCHSTLAAAVSP